MRSVRLLALAAVLALPFSLLPAAETPQAPENVQQLLQDRKYAEAVTAIDEAAKAEGAARDYLGYLKARALHLQGEFDSAVEAYEAVANEFPKSPWARRARFGKALSLARKGDFEGAEMIYRQEAGYLLSVARKQEIAAIYLEFADAYFKPKDESVQPDYQKALEFYAKALEVGPEPEKKLEVELLVAQCQQSLGNLQPAAELYAKFSKEHGESPLDVEARYRLGECQLGLGQLAEARRTWQDLLAERKASKSERLAEAAYNLSATYGLPAPASDEDLALGVASLESFLENYPEHKLASQAHLRIATSYMARGRYEEAVKSLQRFLADERYAARDEVPQARNLLGQSFALQKKFTEALEAWRDYLQKHPAHESWADVQRQIVNVEFLMGLEKRQAKQYDAARELWTDFLTRYPLDERGREILFQFGQMNFEQEKYDEALADWRRLVSKYPQSEEASRAQYMIAATLEEKLSKFDEALKEYRKLTWGSMVAQAQARIQLLTAKSLTIVSERVFRSDETPTIKLTSRNLESVSVRAYRVDLETYFRKMHLARGVEGLDIALIDPDETFEFKVPNYAEHQQLESQIEIPLPKAGDADAAPAGVLAVTVASKTLEATTMVVQTDLDIIVKSSRDEVFVFAENLRTGEPWQGAKLLVSNGSQVFAEAVTGDDGVYQHDYKELHDAADVRVFAVAGGHVASNVIDLNGLGVAVGLADKGYIYTDRPAYRAGQLVHVRGVLRRAAGDAYQIDAGKKYTLDVYDVRSRLVRQEEVVLGEFGSFHTNFILPESSPPGQYRIQVRDADEHSYEGSFLVHEYQLEPVRLAVDTGRRVYYRGEEIEGKITAAYYYGAPLAGRQITYQLAGGRVYTATTDDKGEVPIKLATREFREAAVLPLVVTLAERNLQTAVNFFLATQGFSIAVNTVRPVYVAGETFEATVQTNDAEGKPTSQKLTLTVLEQTTVEGKVGERQVEQHEVTTGDDGQGLVTLRLEKGATYVLRAEGSDRFKNPVSGQHVVQVSDDEDTVRLRILSDKHTYKVGDTAEVKLHWREEPALALVTYQGARVLGYKLVQLQTGANDLPIPMAANLAPNFELSVAVMSDLRAAAQEAKKRPLVRFHEANSYFAVARDLRVKIEPRRKGEGQGPLRPGEEIEVAVETTDPQGKPISAEVSLAMVEQSLLERFGPTVGSIGEFFHGSSRETAVRTTSSITFAYQPSTRPIDRQLLAERDRLEVEAEEAATRALMMDATPRVVMGEEDEALERADDYITIQPKIEALSDLIRSGDSAQSWSEVGGPGAIEEYKNSLSLTIEQSQLRSGTGGGSLSSENRSANDRKDGMSVTVGLAAPGIFSADLDIPFQTMGRFNPNANWSFAALPDAGKLADFAVDGRGDVLVINKDGSQNNLNWAAFGGRIDDQKAKVIVAELNDAGAVLLPGLGPQETGYWNPSVVTDAEGKATITFALPERSTGWTFQAKGITVDTLTGEAASDLAVKKDLFGELKLPLAFTDGDTADITASVHNTAIDKGQITVTLKTTIGGKSVEELKTIDVTAQGIQEVAFKSALALPENAAAQDATVTFELTVAAGERSDVMRRTLPLKPYGLNVFATASGSASSDTTAWVEPAADMPFTSPHLQVIVGPSVERSLLDIVLGPAPYCQIDFAAISSGFDTAASDLMASLALQKLLTGTRDAGGPQAQALDAHVRASLSLLVSSQNDDGGWSWTLTSKRAGETAPASDRYTSAQILWAIALAKTAGYAVPQDAFDKGVGFLQGQITATAESDYETKAILLHALSAAGRGDFALANRLYRNRPALSNAALAHLALAFSDMDRQPTAKELLDLLGERKLDQPATRRQVALGSLPWSQAAVEVRALFALALQRVAPESPQAKELVDWLLAHRTGHRWSPDKATGPATLSLCEWFAKSRFEGEHYQLAVFVNDKQVRKLDIDEQAGPLARTGTVTIDVPADALKEKGKQRVSFQITGRGRYTYQCILGGFVQAEALKSTTKDWTVRRHYQPAPLELDGQEIPRGFGVLQGAYTAFRNPLTQLPVGKRGQVELEIRRNNVPSGTPEAELEYLVVSEPLPAGATVIEQSITGGFERYEIQPGAITFYIGSRQHVEPIRYDLHGYLPGEYRAAPTVIRNAYRADQMAVASLAGMEGPKPLAVLPQNVASVDEYKLTPQELYELGQRHFAKGELPLAGTFLAELLAKWNVNADVYKETARLLLDISLDGGKPAEIVRYFEIVKEKWPDLEISFEKIFRVGAAYHEMGEYERSFLIYRATVESSFLRETGVAGFLEAQGEFVRSVDVMDRLLAEYPPEPYLAAATYALAQRVYAKAPEAASDPKLREKKINRVDLVRQALAMLDAFLTGYPEDPAADQASFSLANALLELKAFDQAIARCERFAERYPESTYLDSYWYIIGYCRFALSQHEAALEMCRKVAETMRADKTTGRQVESPYKWQAVYILGQVYHSLGKAAEAIQEYTRVAERFADAQAAIDYFARKDISLPEVTVIKPGDAADVELKFRNVAKADVKAYRIDLMKFSLLKRNLGGITGINLAGIRPLYDEQIELGDGKDYRDRTRKLTLPLKEEGAYLVVCRGDDLYASGLALVSPLAVEVQEEVSSGQVRATVKDLLAERYLSDVHVKVIGSRNSEFTSGETDLRGVFVAQSIQGTSTVIASAGDRYAFFRGQLELGPPPAAPEPAAKPEATGAEAKPQDSESNSDGLLENLNIMNGTILQKQQEQLKSIYDKNKAGVAPSEAF